MIIPSKLKRGDEIRVVALAASMSIITKENVELAKSFLENLGFKVTFGKHVNETGIFKSASLESKIFDFHEAVVDKNVKAIFAVIGGFNSNELLGYLDYELIKNNPKILCGYSDITALTNAITAKTGLVTYSGPVFSMFAMKEHNEYWVDYFKKCLIENSEISVTPSKEWSDDRWYKGDERVLKENTGFWIINQGKAEGIIIGGNLCTLNLLQGTEYMPSLKGSILFLEDDEQSDGYTFGRDLQSLMHLPDFQYVQAIIIGRFQKNSKVGREQIEYIIKTKKELKNIPVVANVDFGHTNPIITFPIGGTAKLKVDDEVELKILKH